VDTFWWIFLGGVLMSAIALAGSFTLLLSEATLNRVIMPLVAFAAGSLLGGAFFHMLPANLASGSTFLLGGMVAYAASARVDVGFLVPFAAGNFIYIGASDLVPEVNKHRDIGANALHFGAFVTGIALLWGIRVALEP
jgi:zinc transporter ZupT